MIRPRTSIREEEGVAEAGEVEAAKAGPAAAACVMVMADVASRSLK